MAGAGAEQGRGSLTPEIQHRVCTQALTHTCDCPPNTRQEGAWVGFYLLVSSLSELQLFPQRGGLRVRTRGDVWFKSHLDYMSIFLLF